MFNMRHREFKLVLLRSKRNLRMLSMRKPLIINIRSHKRFSSHEMRRNKRSTQRPVMRLRREARNFSDISRRVRTQAELLLDLFVLTSTVTLLRRRLRSQGNDGVQGGRSSEC